MARATWYRLDNIGKFYSAQAGNSIQTVFRYAATLTDEVDPPVLQRALDKTVDAFPNFNVCLRSGMFWHYLEQAAEPPAVSHENLPLCFGLHVDAKSVLFRVSHHGTRVNFEVSHMVSDGRGSLSFFKALISSYLQERYGIGELSLEYDGSDRQKSEDSFDKYYEREKAASTYAPKVYRLSGWRDVADPTFLEYHLPLHRVTELAKAFNVGLTPLVTTAIICAIRADMPHRDRHRAIRLDVPVDLRRVFGSTTTRNFFGLAFVSYVPGNRDESADAIAAQIHDQLRVTTEAERLKSRMNRMISLEKNPLLRLAPLFVKDLVLKGADRLTARETTTTISNIGRVDFDGQLAPHIRNVNLLTSTTGLNFTLCSFADDLSIGISTAYSNLDIIKDFCRFFSHRGIEGYLNVNKTDREIAGDRIEAMLGSSVRRLGGQAPGHDGDGPNPEPPGESDVASGRKS